MWALWVAQGLVLGSFLSVGGQRAQGGGRGVCSTQTLPATGLHTETFVQPVYKPYMAHCQGYRLCSTYRTTYRLSSREVYRTVYRTVYECCPGWSKAQEEAIDCDIDVDECRTRALLCSQRCVNTLGSYRCQCLPGYTLMGNGRSCKRSLAAIPRPTAPPPPLPPAATETGSDGIGTEVQELRSRLEALEQKMKWTLRTFERLMLTTSDKTHLEYPMSLENTRNLISHFQQLDRIDSLSEQIAFLEEKVGSCSCGAGN
ncbi:epidermal growth factor-like protein 7 isoform X2 [Scyliorhinus torazame]|uniref:epidermal growth factor-like protein 7 isoform X2 n=1 Tax=Scyliorhinus torazame TaxID=75743 RepID=UPI003B5B5CAA